MVKDFRNVGRVSPAGQGIVVMAIWLAAGGFFLAGIWLILGMPSPFPQELSFLVGIAFIVSSVFDLIAVKFIKRVWAGQQGR